MTVRRWQVPRAASLFSPLPSASLRIASPTYRAELRRLLREEQWDAVIINFVSMGWVVRELRKLTGFRRPPLVFVTHNHESTVKTEVASAFDLPTYMRIALRYDAWKNARLEKAAITEAALVTAITNEDRDLFQKEFSTKRIVTLTPGYNGYRVPHRLITDETPRRAVMLGSLEWIAKQQNLLEFLRAADAEFTKRQIELQVIGLAPPAFISEMQKLFPWVEFTGAVPDFAPYMARARVGLMVDRVGGGFKHKNLNYIYNGVPVISMAGQTMGLPLVPGHEMIQADTSELLVQQVVSVIDDIETLNKLQSRALAKCEPLFDWSATGRMFRRAIEDVIGRPGNSGTTTVGP